MASRQSVMLVVLGAWVMTQTLLWSSPVEASTDLDPFFYILSCPLLIPIVGAVVLNATIVEPRNAASLLRIHFHDCFVNGCDASDLLDGGEKLVIPNLNSLRAFDVIDKIKTRVEAVCPNTVSCADISTLAAFWSVVLTGGPAWVVPLGRRDSLVPGTDDQVLAFIPSPFLNASGLIANFALQNMTTKDMVVLSGAHTFGLARCFVFNQRLYPKPDPTLNKTLLLTLQKNCPNDPSALSVTNDLDFVTPILFDNQYYKNLQNHNGLLASDQTLFDINNTTKELVNRYASSTLKWFADFAVSMTKMGNLQPLTGTKGEIRKNCHVPNSKSATSVVTDKPRFESEFEFEPQPVPPLTKEEKLLRDARALQYLEATIKQVKADYIRKRMDEIRVEETDATGSHASF